MINPVEKGGKTGGLMWQTMGEGDRHARDVLVRYLEARFRDGGGRKLTEVVIRASDPSVEDIVIPKSSSSSSLSKDELEILTITYLTPQFYSDLLTAPSIPLALELNAKITRRWKTNDDALFLSLFSPQVSETTSSPSDSSSLSRSERFSNNLRSLALPPSFREEVRNQERHPLGTELSFLLSHFFWGQVGYYIFSLSGAKFVEGMESWSEWNRLFDRREEKRLKVE